MDRWPAAVCRISAGQLAYGPVRPVSVVTRDVRGQDALEVSTTEDQHPVKALTAHGAEEPDLTPADPEPILGLGVGRHRSHNVEIHAEPPA